MLNLPLFVNDPTHRFHLRCALWIAFGAAVTVVAGAVFLRFERYDRFVDAQRGYEAENRMLAARLRAIESQDKQDTEEIEGRIRELVVQQAATDVRAKNASAKAPFSIEEVLPAIVEIVCIDNGNKEVYYTGSGTIFDKSGLILTNQHLLRSEDGSLIRLCGIGFTADLHVPPRIRYAARVVSLHADTDLAVLHISDDLESSQLPKEFPVITPTDLKSASLSLKLGDPIFIGGYPGIGAETFTFTQGVVSGRVGSELIKTSALIDSGTSGGAAFDASGRYVGVPTAAAKGDIGGSLGYLISGETVDTFITDYYAGKNRVSSLTR